MAKRTSPVAIHDHGTDMSAAFRHALTLAQGGWMVRTRRVAGHWLISVYSYGATDK